MISNRTESATGTMTTTRMIVPGMHQGKVYNLIRRLIPQIWFSDKRPSRQYFWRFQFQRKKRGYSKWGKSVRSSCRNSWTMIWSLTKLRSAFSESPILKCNSLNVWIYFKIFPSCLNKKYKNFLCMYIRVYYIFNSWLHNLLWRLNN